MPATYKTTSETCKGRPKLFFNENITVHNIKNYFIILIVCIVSTTAVCEALCVKSITFAAGFDIYDSTKTALKGVCH